MWKSPFITNMLKKRFSKKGLAHVDWAVSLGIFLFYLGWYFVFVNPLITPAQNLDVLHDIVVDGFERDVFYDIERARIILPGNITDQYEAVVVPYLWDWNLSNIAFTEQHYDVVDGRFIFLLNKSAKSEAIIYHPHNAFTTIDEPLFLVDENSFRHDTFRIDFEGELIDKIRYKGDTRLFDYSLKIDGTDIDDGLFSKHNISARYHIDDDINHTAYVFAENNKIYTYLESADQREHDVAITATLANYTDYFLDASRSGVFTYPLAPTCTTYVDADFVDFYDADNGLLITLSSNGTLAICQNDSHAFFSLNFSVLNETIYRIIVHDGDHTDVKEYPLLPLSGARQTLKRISQENLTRLQQKPLSELKSNWGYPQQRDFNITLEESLRNITLGTVAPLVTDVYVKTIFGYSMDKKFVDRNVTVRLMVW